MLRWVVTYLTVKLCAPGSCAVTEITPLATGGWSWQVRYIPKQRRWYMVTVPGEEETFGKASDACAQLLARLTDLGILRDELSLYSRIS